MDPKTLTEIAAHLATIAAALTAGWWFIYTSRIKPRLQFDLDCKFIPLGENQRGLVAELQFIFENKGLVEHRLYDLFVSVHTLESEGELQERDVRTKELRFSKSLLPKVQLVPKGYGYYFVRPAVRQVITHIIRVPANVLVIRITSSFAYDKKEDYPHTARRMFSVPTFSSGPHQPTAAPAPKTQ